MNVQSTNTRGHSLKLFKNHCRLDIYKNFVVNRIINVWNAQHESVIACKNINRFINVVRGQAHLTVWLYNLPVCQQLHVRPICPVVFSCICYHAMQNKFQISN